MYRGRSQGRVYIVAPDPGQRYDLLVVPLAHVTGNEDANLLASHSPFNGRLRDELLNETLFRSLQHPHGVLGDWRSDYNEERPRSRPGWLTPGVYADASKETPQGMLRSFEAPHPRLVPSTLIKAQKIAALS